MDKKYIGDKVSIKIDDIEDIQLNKLIDSYNSCSNKNEEKKNLFLLKIENLRKEHCLPERIAKRKEWEGRARDLLENNLGKMTISQWNDFFDLINKDFWKNEVKNTRFHQAFIGQNRNLLLSNLEELNFSIKEIWNDSSQNIENAIAELVSNIKGCSLLLPTLILYLKAPDTNAIMGNSMVKVINSLNNINLRYKATNYSRYKVEVLKFKENFNLEAQELDLLLTLLNEKQVSGINQKKEDILLQETDNIKQSSLDIPLNTILYGPPGTGKTFALKNEYFKYFTDEEATITKEEFCVELIKDLAWWEIISIVMLDIEKAKVQEIYDHPLLQAKITISENKTPKNTIWGWLQRHTKEDCKNVNFVKRDTPLFFSKDENSIWSIDKEIAKNETSDFFDILDKYKNYKIDRSLVRRYVFISFHQAFSYEDFIEGIKPVLLKEDGISTEDRDIKYHIEDGIFKEIAHKAADNPGKNYAIFIDEINRGNIANIFGELITLIEPDKRQDIGETDGLTVILPYSKKEFSVPKNLYIIGTMNTADRSVEALDTALRRRFNFIEKAPNTEILLQDEYKIDIIDLSKLLLTINSRIEVLIDKDHRIGHSYFMEIKKDDDPESKLKEVFKHSIIPLLEEYFYGDPVKIGMVLGTDFVKKRQGKISFAKGFSDETEDYDEAAIYDIKDPMNLELASFVKIYQNDLDN